MTTAESPSSSAPTGDAAHDARRVKVRLFRLRNKLKEKAGVGRAAAGDSVVAVEALEKALSEMKKSQEDYPDWVRATLTELGEDLKSATDNEGEERRKHFKHIGSIAHELKGQGGTFGYPLISVFGKSLNEFCERNDVGISSNHLEILKAHIDVMRAVIKDRISGDGGDIGRELIAVLHSAIKKNAVTQQMVNNPPPPPKAVAKHTLKTPAKAPTKR